MKKSNIKMLLVGLFIMLFMIPTANAQFLDLAPNHWGFSAIMEFVQKGYLKGYEDGTFRPDATITRAEFVHVINNYFGFTGNETVATTLSDVDQNEWYAKGVNEAVARGYMIGYEDGTFRPNNPITRQEAMVVLAKILNLNDNTPAAEALEYLKAKYSDYATIGDWALNAVYNFTKLGYINGYEDGTLRADISMTRTEVVHMIKPVEQKIVIEKEETEKPDKGGSGGGGGAAGPSVSVTYYTITINESANGTVTASATRVEKGNNVIITVAPATDYELAELLINGANVTDSVVDGTYTVTNVQANITVNATFSPIIVEEPEQPEQPEEPVVKYTITVTSNEKGTAVADLTEVEEGLAVAITLAPGEAYRLYTLIDNGEDVTENVIDGVYTITNVQANHEVVATFGCNCEESVSKLIETIKGIVDNHAELFAKKLESLKGDAKAIEAEIEAALGKDIETSEYKAEIEEVIAELESAEYKELSDKALATIEKIVCSEKFESALAAIESVLPDKQKEEIKVLLNKIESKINAEVAEIKVEVEDFIENHDCKEVQAFITKLDNKLQSIDSMEILVKEVEKYIKANVSREDIEKAIEALANNSTIQEIKEKLQNDADKIIEEITNKIIKAKEYQAKIEEVIDTLKEIKDSIPTEAELKAMAEELLAKGEATLETLKAKLEEKVAEREAKIKEVIEEIKAEIKENLPTDAELRVMAEELLAKNQAKLDTLKEKLIAKLKGELVDAEARWNEYLAQIKDQIVANLPTKEIFDELISKIDSVMPEVEEKTGISFSNIASKLGINADTVSEALETIAQDETLKNTVINTLKNKVSDLIANELSDNQTVKDALDTVYDATEKDVADAVLKLAEKDTTGITVKIILANTDLEDVFAAIDEDITDEDLETVVKACTDYYGLAQFIKTVDALENPEAATRNAETKLTAKNLIMIALKNANAEDLAKLISDKTTQDIIVKHLNEKEIVEVLGEVGKKIIGDKLEDKIEELTKVATVTYYDENGNLYETMDPTVHYNVFDGTKLREMTIEKPGYTFEGWATTLDGDVKYADKAKLTSGQLGTTEVTLYAVWEANTYTITSYSSNGNSVTAKAKAKTDEIVTITVVEANEYQKLKEVKVNGKIIEGNSFVMPACDVTITAIFDDNTPTAYTITTISTDETKGTISSDLPKTTAGNDVIITVKAEAGYKLDTITIDNNTVELAKVDEKTYTFTMPASDVTVTATFALETYKVMVKNTQLATVTASLEEATVEDTIIVTVSNIAAGYELISVTANGDLLTEVDGVSSFEMYAEDVTITAEIEAIDYTVTINGEIPEGCSATVNRKEISTTSNIDKTVTIACEAALGYRVSISFDTEVKDVKTLLSTSDYLTKTFTMPANNVVVNVVFTTVPVNTVTVIGDGNGTVTLNRGDTTVGESIEAEYGETVYITIIPNPKYSIKKISGIDKLNDESDRLGTYIKSFVMSNENITITVEFEATKHNITVDKGITVSDSVKGEYTEGLNNVSPQQLIYVKSDVDVEVRDAEGNKVDFVYVSFLKYGTFLMPASDVTITVK